MNGGKRQTMKVVLIFLVLISLASPSLARERKSYNHSSKAKSHPDYRPPYRGEKLLMDRRSGEKVYGDYGSYYWPYKYTSPSYERKEKKP